MVDNVFARNGNPSGIRVEISGVASNSRLSARIYHADHAVEIEWNSATSVTYQVQWCTELLTNSWSNLGGTVSGSGGVTSVHDSITDFGNKFYRVTIPN